MKKLKIAIVGATGMVGRTFLKVIAEKVEAGDADFANAEYVLFASKSAGEIINFLGREHKVIKLEEAAVKKAKPDFALFSAGGEISVEWAPIFNAVGCVVIDNSSAFRRDPNVPLVVPECNPDALKSTDGKRHMIISNPNCSTIGAVVALKPLDDAFKIRRIVYSTYQAVSGAGAAGVEQYKDEMHGGIGKQKFRYQIFNNLIPQIDDFNPCGNTKEEEKMIHETKKILGRDEIAVTATTVRVPIENCHSISINVEFKRKPDITRVKEILRNAPGVVLADDPANFSYPMPILADNRDEVFVGRVRTDNSAKNAINLFTVSDNIRKGAATNAVQILKMLI